MYKFLSVCVVPALNHPNTKKTWTEIATSLTGGLRKLRFADAHKAVHAIAQKPLCSSSRILSKKFLSFQLRAKSKTSYNNNVVTEAVMTPISHKSRTKFA